MSPCSSSSMQMPTPPMTLAECQWERHHQCNEWQCLLSDEGLAYNSNDWTLFPNETTPLAKPTPRRTAMDEGAKTPRPPQGRAQMDSKTRKQQRRTGSKKERMTKPHRACTTKNQTNLSATEQNVTSLTGSSIKIECSDVLTGRFASFENLPRTSKSAPTVERFPTPPLEDMGEMFAPIEALGEDLRWYRSVQGSHHGSEKAL